MAAAGAEATAGAAGVAAVGDTMWARFLVELLGHWPSGATRYVRSNTVMTHLRARKDAGAINESDFDSIESEPASEEE